jgi:hypothetical protein
VQTDAEQAESFKNEGNKFFKAGDYAHAVEFYTKGESAGNPSSCDSQLIQMGSRRPPARLGHLPRQPGCRLHVGRQVRRCVGGLQAGG